MFVIIAIFNFLDFLSRHPLYWQTPLSLIGTVGGFAWFKHKVAIQGRARITAWLTAIGTVTVFLHMLIVGLPVLSTLGLIKVTAEQTVLYIGFMTLVYNFLKDRVVAFLTSAEADSPASNTSATSTQNNQGSATTTSAEAAGVATF